MLCLHVCTCQTFFLFLSQDIIILTARCKEANNYVTQKAISSPRLGHLLVLPLLPPTPPPVSCSSAPLPHTVNVSLTGWKTAPSTDCPLIYFPLFLWEAKNALITIPAVQGYLKVLCLSWVGEDVGRGDIEEREWEKERTKMMCDKERGEREIRQMWGSRWSQEVNKSVLVKEGGVGKPWNCSNSGDTVVYTVPTEA